MMRAAVVVQAIRCPHCGRRLFDASGVATITVLCPRRRCRQRVTVWLDAAGPLLLLPGPWHGGPADPGEFEDEVA